jgi:hypothetical protein
MIWVALRELRARRTASLLAGVGLLTATLGFVVLASTSETTQAVLKGDVEKSWPAPYDLVVRPVGSQTPLENQEGLVRANYLSSVDGGITDDQLQTIRNIASVDVAAPIAVVGIYNWQSIFPVGLASALDPKQSLQLFRLTITATADAGTSHIPYPYALYVALAASGELLEHRDAGKFPTRTLVTAAGTIDCWDAYNPERPYCWAPKANCSPCYPELGYSNPFTSGDYNVPISQPMLIAGVDPVAEAALSGLNRCVISGKYLDPAPLTISNHQTNLPVLLSTRTFLDETFQIKVDQLAGASAISASKQPDQVSGWMSATTRSITAQDAYNASVTSSQALEDPASPILRPGDVSYIQIGNDRLAATPVNSQPIAYDDPYHSLTPLALRVPPEVSDTGFRTLTPSKWNNQVGGTFVRPSWGVQGMFDPGCLARSDGSASVLTGYTIPQVTFAGKQLGPTRSDAGYVTPAPTIITTLEGARFFADPHQYDPALGAKYISAVRVKVRGVGAPGPVSQARITRVAAAIAVATGLQVDIVRGSSPRAISVDLPAGKFGRPAGSVQENWAVKGVVFKFLKAVSQQNLAMFAIVLVAAMLLVGQTSYSAVQRRRAEFGVLRAIGWRATDVAWLVEIEMFLLGGAVGIVAVALGFAAVLALHLSASWQLVGAVPVAVLVAVVAAAVPAMSAAQGTVVSRIHRTPSIPRSHLPSALTALGVRDLRTQWRSEAVLGIGAIILGASLFGIIVLLEAAFRGQLDTSALGQTLSATVQPFHVALAVMTLLVGALATSEVTALGYMERRPHFAVLRACGWSRLDIAWFVAGQAIAMAIAAEVISAGACIVVGLLTGADPLAIVLGVLGSVLAAFLAASLACVWPLLHASSDTIALALKGE